MNKLNSKLNSNSTSKKNKIYEKIEKSGKKIPIIYEKSIRQFFY